MKLNCAIVQSYIRILVVNSKEGKRQSNVAVKIVIEEWVAKKATDFTFGRVHTKRIENIDLSFAQKQCLQSTSRPLLGPL